jgi:hypothetical protein
MTTTKSYNPIHRAIRELTTPQARRWYWQQLQTTATLAQRIGQQGLTLARHWLNASRGQVAVVEPVQDDAPAAWAALEANEGITSVPVQTKAAALETVPTPSVVAQTKLDDGAMAAAEDEGIEDSHNLPMVSENEPLRVSEIPFDDELECGPPFLEEEEDTSFYLAEEDEDTDNLLYDDTEPDPSPTKADLSAMIQAYLRQQDTISSESSEEEAIAHPSAVLDSPSGVTAFAWEEHPVASDSADGAKAGA